MLFYLMILAFGTSIFLRHEIGLSNIFLNSMEYILFNAYVPFINYLYKINLKPCILDIKKRYVSEWNVSEWNDQLNSQDLINNLAPNTESETIPENNTKETINSLDINHTNIKLKTFSIKEDIFNNPEKFISESQKTILNLIGSDTILEAFGKNLIDEKLD